jgi:tetratricopeptide (TPR) repeat protein
MTPRRALAMVAVLVAVSALAYAWWSTPGSSDGRWPANSESGVPAPPLPDLSRLDQSARQQLRERHAALVARLDDGGSSASQRADAFGSLGMLLFATEYWAEAEQVLLRAQALAPEDRRWPYYLGHLYRTRQEPARAIPMFERVLTIAPDDVPAMVWLGELHLLNGDAAAGAPYLQRAAVLQPQSAAVVSRLGRAALANRDYPRAIELLERVLQLQPEASSVYYPLAMAYRGAGQTSRAEAYLSRQGSNDDGIAPVDPLMDAVAGLLQGAAAFEARGMAALDARDWKAAVGYLRTAVALAPGNAVTRLNLGTALSLAGDPASARIELLEAVRLAPDLAKAQFGLGLLAQDEGEWDAAVERFTAAVRAEPDFGDAHFALAEALRRTGRAAESLAHYERVLMLNAAASQARFGYAMALVRLRRFADATTWLTEASSLHPEQAGFPHALARILAASPDAGVRDGRQALALMQPLMTQQPGPSLHETMAMAYAELGNFAAAASSQERAIATARQAGQEEAAARMQDNLALYRRGEPCRTPWRDDDPVIAQVSR